jgi:putative transposase
VKRTNTFEVVPQSDEDEELIRRLLDASAALWNEINYERREHYADPDADVWEIDEYRGRYGGVLGASTVQQIERKNREAWNSFFALKEKGEANGKPGFWGNQEDGRELRTYIRNTSYSVEWGEYSRLEILVGQDLKDEYGLGDNERLRLEVRGDPNWTDYDKQGQLELYYDEHSDQFRAFQPVTVDDSRLASPLADESAGLDIGANNSSRVPRRPARNCCTRGAGCSSGSETPPRRSPDSNRCWTTASTPRSGSARCTADGRDDVITPRTRSVGT